MERIGSSHEWRSGLRLDRLILENFKSFGDRTVVPMAPITLLFGENSAGKSSILQSLLLLKQTAQHAETGAPLLLPRGEYTDLGSIREMLYGHDPERTAEISLLFGGAERSDSFWPLAPNSPGIGVRFGCREGSVLDQLVIRELPIYWGATGFPLATLGSSQTEAAVEAWTTGGKGTSWQRLFQSGERFYTSDGVSPEHPALRALYEQFVDYWRDLARALREWPALESIKTWEAYDEDSDEPAQAEGWEYSAQGYVTAVIERFRQQGRDLIAELLDRFDDYTYEQFVADTNKRSSTYYRLRGFQLVLPTDPGGRRDEHHRYYPDEDWFVRPPHLPSLEGVLGAMFRLMYDGDGLLEVNPHAEGMTATEVSYALLPNISSIASETEGYLRSLIERLAYVGPLRARPSRHYLHSGLAWPSVDKAGANLPEILLSDEKVLADLNEALRIMGGDYQIAAIQPDDSSAPGLFWLRLTDTRTGIAVSPLDVGFGVGQVLPVLAQLLVSKNQVLLFEQPEIHLHPRLQAELGSLFAKSISGPYNNQIIMETHSEYVIYRLQKLIRLGQLNPEDVSVVYVTKDECGSHCLQLRLDEDGDFLDPWPGGFFDTGFDEIFGLK